MPDIPRSLDLQEAARWFEKAGEVGHAEAQFNLGEMFLWSDALVGLDRLGQARKV